MDNWQAPGRLDQLRSLVAEGKSASIIAQEMKATSRNAVIGAAHRYGVTLHGSPCQGERLPAGRKPRVRQSRINGMISSGPPLPPQPIKPSPETDVAYGEPTDIVNVRGCRWPISGTGYQTLFCNAKKYEASSYCRKHYVVAGGRLI